MEPAIGFVVALVLGIAIPVYLRWFATEAERNKPFERWCRTHPVVLAIRCDPKDTIGVYDIVRREIEPHDEFINSAGRFPWQYYVYRIDCRRLNDEIITCYVTRCRPIKIHERKPDLTKGLEAICRDAGDRIEEIWLHGQLHAVQRTLGVEKENAAWLGDIDDEKRLQVTGMIGQPPWLSAIKS